MPLLETADLAGEVARLRDALAELGGRVRRLEAVAAGPRTLPDGTVRRAEAARLLGVSVETMHAWAKRGGGPPFRILAGRARYQLADIQAFAATRPRPPRRRTAPAALPLLPGIGSAA